VGPRVGLDGRKISSPQGFDPEPSITIVVFIQNHTVSGQMGYETAQNLRFLSTFPKENTCFQFSGQVTVCIPSKRLH